MKNQLIHGTRSVSHDLKQRSFVEGQGLTTLNQFMYGTYPEALAYQKLC